MWFALRGAAPGDRELPGVLSNEPALPGMLHVILPKAHAEGASRLTCYAVRNDLWDNGLLPGLFGKHGWREARREPLDIAQLGPTPDAQMAKLEKLRTVWKEQGWDEARHGLPDIVHMTYERPIAPAGTLPGTESAEETEEEGSLPAITERFEGEAVESLAEGEIGQARILAGQAPDRLLEDGAAGTDDPGAGGAAGGYREILSRDINTFESDLETASGLSLEAWGINEADRTELLAKLRVQMAEWQRLGILDAD